MSSTSNYDTGFTPCMPGRNVKFTNLHVCEDGDIDGNLEVNTINGLPYPPGGGFLPTPVANRILRTTGLTVEWGSVTPSNFTGGLPGDVLKTISPGVVAWDPVKVNEITPGLANQIMHTNALGTAAEWTSSLTVPGNANFAGDIALAGNSGTVGQVLTKTGAATQDWQTLSVPTSSIVAGADNTVLTSAGGATYWITPNVINIIKYATTFNAQNINSGAGPTALSFNTTPYVNTAISTVGAPALISQPSATQFTIGTLGVYNIDITGYIDPTSAGIGNSVVTLSIEVAGSEKTEQCVVCNGEFSFSGRFSCVLLTAGANVRILARRVSGTGTLYTFASGSLAPSFASSIMFST